MDKKENKNIPGIINAGLTASVTLDVVE